MANLQTTYMGLSLKSPIIVGSSALTKTVENIIKIEQAGAGAVVLKSLFEEQIRHEVHNIMKQGAVDFAYPEAADYIQNYTREHGVGEYLKLIADAKKAVKIPIIASVNCISSQEWISFAKKIQDAGADALELNIFLLPADDNLSGEEHEKIYFDIVDKLKTQINIPIAVKIGYHFSGLSHFIKKLSWTGIKGITMFNRFFSTDIDLKTRQVVSTHVFSSPDELSIPLKWIAIMSDRIKIDIAASTGVHDGDAAIKLLLAGANAVQVCSCIYKNGIPYIQTINNQIETWMKENKYAQISDFNGSMSYDKVKNPAAYERVQFMKHYAGVE